MTVFRDFKGVFIVKEVWDNPRLNPYDICIWAMIETQGNVKKEILIDNIQKKFGLKKDHIHNSFLMLAQEGLIQEVIE